MIPSGYLGILGILFIKKFFRLGKALASRLYQVQACDWVHLAQALIPLPWGFYPYRKN
jgi:hypothetical protein